jgi:hypothetical protein
MSDFYKCNHGETLCGSCVRALKTQHESLESERNQLKESILRHEEVGVRQNKEIERLKAQLQKATSDHCMDVFVPIEKWEKIQSQLAVARQALQDLHAIACPHWELVEKALKQLSDAGGNK